ncbi:MAG: prepilin peptidase [bacterium]|nr:prepilin peptidase [bacterium]
MNFLILFVLGASIGSFIGVIGDRYKENLPVWSKKIIGGRSRCESCGRQLRWFELIPVLSFILQRGKCNSCGKRLGWRYLAVELASGFLFVFVPMVISREFYVLTTSFYILSVLWISVFSVLLVVSIIDYRLRLIPDEANLGLAFLGVLITALRPFNETSGSFMGYYGILFGFHSDRWLNHFLAAALAGIFFAILILVTKGRGMGGGDMKLVAAMGLIFGWPDIVLVAILSFIIGSVFGIGAIMLKKEKFKSKIAFGPFMAFSGLLVFFFGYQIMSFYFGLLGVGT